MACLHRVPVHGLLLSLPHPRWYRDLRRCGACAGARTCACRLAFIGRDLTLGLVAKVQREGSQVSSRSLPCCPSSQLASDDRQRRKRFFSLLRAACSCLVISFAGCGREDSSSAAAAASSFFLVQPLLTLSAPIAQLAARRRFCSPPHALPSSRGASIPAYTARIPLKRSSTLRKQPSISNKSLLLSNTVSAEGQKAAQGRRERDRERERKRGTKKGRTLRLHEGTNTRASKRRWPRTSCCRRVCPR